MAKAGDAVVAEYKKIKRIIIAKRIIWGLGIIPILYILSLVLYVILLRINNHYYISTIMTFIHNNESTIRIASWIVMVYSIVAVILLFKEIPPQTNKNKKIIFVKRIIGALGIIPIIMILISTIDGLDEGSEFWGRLWATNASWMPVIAANWMMLIYSIMALVLLFNDKGVREIEQEALSKGLNLRQLLADSNKLRAKKQNYGGSITKQSASANSGWSTFGNVMWLIFGGGLSTCLEYALAGIVSCITLIGIPFGIQYFKLAGLVILPFGKQVVTEKEGCLTTGMNILWIFTVGLPVTLTHLFWGIILTITIIGFPFAKQHFKLMVLSFTPFGKRVY